MKIMYAIGLILVLFLSACAAPQQPAPVTTPDETEQVEETAEGETEEVEVVAEDEEEVEAPAAAGGDIRILGKDNIDPEALKVSVGSTVAWINEGEEGVTLNFKRGGRVFKAEYIKPEATMEMTFDEAGTVEYEVLESLGTIGTVTVE